jgi:hypothetical protein
MHSYIIALVIKSCLKCFVQTLYKWKCWAFFGTSRANTLNRDSSVPFVGMLGACVMIIGDRSGPT